MTDLIYPNILPWSIFTSDDYLTATLILRVAESKVSSAILNKNFNSSAMVVSYC